MIKVRELTTFFGEKLIHAGLDLTLAPGRIHVLMGPSGGGKSSLLKIIARSASLPQPGVTAGEVLVDGAADYSSELFFTVLQKIDMFSRTGLDLLVESVPQGHRYTRSEKEALALKFVAEQGIPLTVAQLTQNYTLLPYGKKTVLLCAMAILNDRPYVCLDEPTAKVGDQEAVEILEVVRKIREAGKTVLCVLHNQKHARLIGDEIHLLAGGGIIETSAINGFFATPTTEAGRTFLETGSCAVPAPDTSASALSDASAIYKRILDADKPVPTGFHWLLENQLAGCMRPGLLCREEDDLARLRRLGISHLLNLEEEAHVPLALLAGHGITPLHFPIDDMRAPPDQEVLRELLAHIRQLLQSGARVAVHCKAGLGRTGTVLACYTALTRPEVGDPVAFIRRVNPRWVQSEEQENFIAAFAEGLATIQPTTS